MFSNWLQIEEPPIKCQILLHFIRPRQNKRMKILVLSKKFSASSCNIFSTFQMFKTDIWFFGFFPEFQPNYFWRKMFSRYSVLILFNNFKILCKVVGSQHYIMFSAGARFILFVGLLIFWGAFHTIPEQSEDGGFTLKAHQMFSVHTTTEEDSTITSYFGFMYEKISSKVKIYPSYGRRF